MPTKRRPAFPTNRELAAAIAEVHAPLLEGATRRSASMYQFSEEDRLDLVAAAFLRVAQTDWRSKLRSNLRYIRQHFGWRSSYSLQVCKRVLYGYSKTLVLNAAITECRRLRIGGLTGLWVTPMSEMPFQDAEMPEEARDGLPDAQAAKQVYEFAYEVLNAEELQAVKLCHGFDGGGSRRTEQVAREMGIAKPEAERLLASAIIKLRMRAGVTLQDELR